MQKVRSHTWPVRPVKCSVSAILPSCFGCKIDMLLEYWPAQRPWFCLSRPYIARMHANASLFILFVNNANNKPVQTSIKV
eukprot:1144884-Pelagomonas_calceolata.AAC.4